MSDLEVIAELNHLVNSPLAAIRNALYLAAARSDDPELHRYLQICNQEVTSIAQALRQGLAQARAARWQREVEIVRIRRAAA